MSHRYALITLLILVSLLHIGCLSPYFKDPLSNSNPPELTPEIEVHDTPEHESSVTDSPISDSLVSETPTDVSIYIEEEATLSAILNLYEEAKDAL
jgi:hypothetical protein